MDEDPPASVATAEASGADPAGQAVPRPAPATPEDLGEVAAAWMLGGPSYLPYRVALLSKMIDRETTRLLYDSAGISLAEWRVLGQLSIAAPATVRSLADKSWVDRAEVSRAAASLEQAGYVERRDNPADRRSTLFSLTPAGRALVDKLRPLRLDFHSSLTGQLTDTQRDTFEEALLILARACMERLRAYRDRSTGNGDAEA